MINRRLLKDRREAAALKAQALAMSTDSAVMAMDAAAADIEAWAGLETALEAASSPSIEAIDGEDPLSFPVMGKWFQKREAEEPSGAASASYERAALTSRGGSAGVATKSSSSSVQSMDTSSASSVSSASSSSSLAVETAETYVIETPLFPIILPKAWQPLVGPSAPSASSVESPASTASVSTVSTLEIEVEIQEEVATAAAGEEAKPSPHLLAAASAPLLPTDAAQTFTGREFYYPETIEALAVAGMRMTTEGARNPDVVWTGQGNTMRFLKKQPRRKIDDGYSAPSPRAPPSPAAPLAEAHRLQLAMPRCASASRPGRGDRRRRGSRGRPRRGRGLRPRRTRPTTSARAALVASALAFSSGARALTLPKFKGVRVGDRPDRRSEGTRLASSVGWTVDGEGSSGGMAGIWKMFDNNGSGNNRRKYRRKLERQDRTLETMQLRAVPFGPVPRGGSLSDVAVLPTASAASATAVAQDGPLRKLRRGLRGAGRGLVGAAVNLNGILRFNPLSRDGNSASSSTARQSTLTTMADVSAVDDAKDDKFKSPLRIGGMINRRLLKDRREAAALKARALALSADSAVMAMDTAAADIEAWAGLETALEAASSSSSIEAIDRGDPSSFPAFGRWFQKDDGRPKDEAEKPSEAASMPHERAALSSRGGSASASVSNRSGSGSAQSAVAAAASSASSAPSVASSSGLVSQSVETYVVETPLFPIVLPKAWQPLVGPSAPSFEPTDSSATTVSTQASTLEIDVVVQEEVATAASGEEAKPSPQLLAAASAPLLPTDAAETFTGREFYYPETIEALAVMGMRMTTEGARNPDVAWTGQGNTMRFLKKYGAEGATTASSGGAGGGTSGDNADGDAWYRALDSTQEILVWAGKFSSKEGRGADLPAIKATAVIRKSPRELAALLMDSSRVKAYNKMSLGREDLEVFQEGIDSQGGAFGDGESKVVRNLTKPPMISSLVEFVTCMHARKLRPDDADVLGIDRPTDGYVVVSRAATGGRWNDDDGGGDGGGGTGGGGEKRVRNEILLGVNVLRELPGDPTKTILTSVTHVHSPLIPPMLAKGAGTKGAVDFVRDVRALP
ncbi:hypothetical protein ACHAWF_007980 [Thalassiosira exigua]